MCEVGKTDSWRVREVEVSIEEAGYNNIYLLQLG
jgi:hypothetical protein